MSEHDCPFCGSELQDLKALQKHTDSECPKLNAVNAAIDKINKGLA